MVKKLFFHQVIEKVTEILPKCFPIFFLTFNSDDFGSFDNIFVNFDFEGTEYPLYFLTCAQFL